MSTSTSSPRAADRSREFSGLAADYANYDGLGLADLIAKKKISPLELLHAVRQRVDAFNPQLNALCHLFFDRAEAQIHKSMQAWERGHFAVCPTHSKIWASIWLEQSRRQGAESGKTAWLISIARWSSVINMLDW